MSKNKKENIEQEVEQPVVNEQQPEVEAENAQATEGAEEEVVVSKEEELAGKLAEANDKYVRLAAEFDNYRRRVAREKLDIIATASEDVIKGILPVLDD
ncbi:MAG: nucleotide exchange factor GrpE, partial [Bacteroidales bacterium]|nr:nucleotide exchange factor GrpE [Bacteroidales bacterium]